MTDYAHFSKDALSCLRESLYDRINRGYADPPGRWRVECYPSGTVVVDDNREEKIKNDFGVVSRGVGPHISIGYMRTAGGFPVAFSGEQAPSQKELEDRERNRYVLAVIIADILNGAATAKSAGLKRTGEITGDFKGIDFVAIGPFVDEEPPNCKWVQDDRYEAKLARARLMDSIFGIGVNHEAS